MGTNKQAKQAESERAAAYAKQSEAASNIKPTEEAQGVNKAAYEDFNTLRNGDISKLPFVAQYLNRSGQARQKAMSTTLTGDASLASRVANPNLITSSRELMDRSFEQQQATDVTNLASAASNDASNTIMGFSGQQASNYAAQAGVYGQQENSAFQRYLKQKQEGTFWTKLGKGVMSGVGAFAALGGSLAGVPGLGGLFPGKD
jgi:hypothetical protein